MVLPSDGENSISLWDTQDPQALHEWLNDNLGADCTTVLSEVQEDFCFGLSLDLARMRAADKVCSVWGRGWQGLQVAALCIGGSPASLSAAAAVKAALMTAVTV